MISVVRDGTKNKTIDYYFGNCTNCDSDVVFDSTDINPNIMNHVTCPICGHSIYVKNCKTITEEEYNNLSRLPEDFDKEYLDQFLYKQVTVNKQNEIVGIPVDQFEHIFGEDNVINDLNIKPASADKGGRYIW